jgi:serine/threonine-protein kinase
MVRVGDGSQLWGEKYTRRADDVLQVEGEIAATIARTLLRQLSGEEKARLARVVTADPEAYRLYLKGRDFLRGSQQEMDRSIELLQQAVAKAPEYALAHAGLAQAYTRQAFLRASARTEVLANGARFRESRAGARSRSRGGPHRTGPGALLLRVGLGGRGVRVSSRARAQPGQQRGS